MLARGGRERGNDENDGGDDDDDDEGDDDEDDEGDDGEDDEGDDDEDDDGRPRWHRSCKSTATPALRVRAPNEETRNG